MPMSAGGRTCSTTRPRGCYRSASFGCADETQLAWPNPLSQNVPASAKQSQAKPGEAGETDGGQRGLGN
jgi:hypothetical protein